MTVPRALLRDDTNWVPFVRKENNSLWVFLKEGSAWPPEDAGTPPMILFGPSATIKMRSSASNAFDQLQVVLYTMYQGRYGIVERVATREWALVASIGNSTTCGQIPIQYRLEMPQITPELAKAGYQRILDAALRTQNYDRGLDRFARKFDNTEEMTATIAIQEGWQGDHGWSIFFEQGPRRCPLVDTADGLTGAI
jgi:hypothetical protein